MTNPWLSIPLADYEGHMALPQIGQAQLLSDIFADALGRYTPRSVAIPCCAGGNGFERISPSVTRRVVGLDINPEYIRQVRMRFAGRFDELELFTGDIQAERFDFAPVDLLFAGLMFEYVDTKTAFAKIPPMLNPGGVLVAVVQLPSAAIPEISHSPFTSLLALSHVMRLVPAEELERLASVHSFHQSGKRLLESAGGKFFQALEFVRHGKN